jgi:hypothetical protein
MVTMERDDKKASFFSRQTDNKKDGWFVSATEMQGRPDRRWLKRTLRGHWYTLRAVVRNLCSLRRRLYTLGSCTSIAYVGAGTLYGVLRKVA